REGTGARHRNDRRRRRAAPGRESGLDLGGERGERRPVKDEAYGQLDGEGRARPADHLRREQRVPTESEEIIFASDRCNAEEIAPDPGEEILDWRRRRREPLALAVFRDRQGVAVD